MSCGLGDVVSHPVGRLVVNELLGKVPSLPYIAIFPRFTTYLFVNVL